MFVASCPSRINPFHPRLGPLSIEQKKRAFTKRAKFEKDKAEERKPQELKEEDIARSENETTKNVATVSNVPRSRPHRLTCFHQLETLLEEEEGPINLFKFVINPNDFAQSVENIFYLSFLIRDGKVALETQEDGQVVICTISPPLWITSSMHLQSFASNPTTMIIYLASRNGKLCWSLIRPLGRLAYSQT
jgi:hypothetical protein